jgi:hypothetical protein
VRFTFGIDYALPGGPVGWLVDRLFIAPRVRRDQRESLERARSLLERAAGPSGSASSRAAVAS